MAGRSDGIRAVSPVVGTVLVVAIVVAIAAVGAGMLLNLTDETDPQPEVVLESEPTQNATQKLVHREGQTLDGDQLELQGAADPEVAAGTRLSSSETLTFYPVAEEITVVWHGDTDESYTLTTLTVDRTLPEPDENCEWVDTETNGGVESIKIDNVVVNCDVETEENIEILNGGVVIGDATSNLKVLDADDAEVYGDATVENVLNLQDGLITGSATSRTADVKIDDGTVRGPIDAHTVAEVTGGTVVEGDLRSQTKDSKILGNSVVKGSVTADGTVKIQDSEVGGDVYVDPGDFDCTNAEINGQDCASYTPKDPSDW